MRFQEMLRGTEEEVCLMKKHIQDFCLRGAVFAWGGPVILAVIWASLKGAGALTSLSVNEAVRGIISLTVMAFIAAGVTILYQIESLPKAFAGLIHMTVLYFDYLGFYLLNGWIPPDRIWIFTLIFIAVFAVVWFIIYMTVRSKVDKMNRMITP